MPARKSIGFDRDQDPHVRRDLNHAALQKALHKPARPARPWPLSSTRIFAPRRLSISITHSPPELSAGLAGGRNRPFDELCLLPGGLQGATGLLLLAPLQSAVVQVQFPRGDVQAMDTGDPYRRRPQLSRDVLAPSPCFAPALEALPYLLQALATPCFHHLRQIVHLLLSSSG
jgi:hypothetical protein